MKHFFLTLLVVLSLQTIAQHRVEVSEKAKYFENPGFDPDQAIKIKLLSLLNGSVGLNYEIALLDWFNMEVGAGFLTKTFNGETILIDLIDDIPNNYGKGGYYLSFAPTFNLTQDFIGDYWGLRPTYTYYQQTTVSGQKLFMSRYTLEMVIQYSFDYDLFAELVYGISYQNSSDFYGSLNISLGYIF